MKDFFEGTSLGGKAKIETVEHEFNRLPIYLDSKKDRQSKHKLLEIDYKLVDLACVHTIVDLSRAFGNPLKDGNVDFIYTFSSYAGVSQKLKEIFEQRPFWRIAMNMIHRNDCGISLKERADETEIHLARGTYGFTFNPDYLIPSLILRIKATHGTQSERNKMATIRAAYNRTRKRQKGEL